MFKKKDNRPKTQKIILKEFPIISITDVENIDYNIKSRTSLKTIPLTNKDYSKVVREEITDYCNCANADKLEKNVIELQLATKQMEGCGCCKKIGFAYWHT